jgi:MazG family protein
VLRHPAEEAGRTKPTFDDLVALQAQLLSPEGCPWDREQSHASLRTYLLEETYEALAAMDAGDPEKMASELGDLLLQIVFHAELARRAGRFAIGDVVERIYTKMVRRHPHVFGEARAESAAQVLKSWEQLKAEERRGDAAKEAPRESLLDGLPHTLPATLEAFQMTRRAARIGFDWDDLAGVLEKVAEEVREVAAAASRGDASARELPFETGGAPSPENRRAKLAEEVGDLLFVAVNVARFLDVDPELALKRANRKFAARFREMEQEAARQGRRLAEVPREEMEGLWERSKGQL